ncbi:hypothetical protein PG984_012348 [Apiospora sp. TS-2023a]
MAASKKTPLPVAVVQAEPVWLDLDATVDKTCALIGEAASNGARLVSFPECWIPGYPAWIWDRPVDPEMIVTYTRNSLPIASAQMDRIRACAAQHQIVVVLGFSENRHDSLYISQAVIDADGKLLSTRSKMKASHMERTVFGDASAECLSGVTETAVGRVGALNCWEHCQPLLKYHTYSQREQIHIAAWPPMQGYKGPETLWSYSLEGCENLSRTYAIESQSFVLHTTAVIGQAAIERMRTQSGLIMATPGGGCSAVFGPDGRKLTENIPEGHEGILYADLDFDEIIKSKSFVDVCGHYSRPDLLWLGVDKDMKTVVREK